MSNRKRFYISVVWTVTVILAGVAMLVVAVTGA
jgi:hypothetical protein